MYKLIHRTCTELPQDITGAIENAVRQEENGSIAQETLGIILESASLSRGKKLPLCQDTGVLFAFIQAPPDERIFQVEDAIKDAVKRLTKEGILRQNCVDPETEANTLDNTGPYVPQIHFAPVPGPMMVSIMLKGGGSENVSLQYSLPLQRIHASRDLEGVRRCVLDAAHQAQGHGCAPGILGVCIGGDRASGYLVAKKQLFRKLDHENPSPVLASLEQTILQEANTLGIGPMGLGGRTTLLGVKIGVAGRHPASYYVTVSYSCWATRRYTAELSDEGNIRKWN
ncbi:MAG TPA: fumarate hydratase [Desulfomonilia bacterium]|nr:fumarate hydratase [Desulfomonilia bacterium]